MHALIDQGGGGLIDQGGNVDQVAVFERVAHDPAGVFESLHERRDPAGRAPDCASERAVADLEKRRVETGG